MPEKCLKIKESESYTEQSSWPLEPWVQPQVACTRVPPALSASLLSFPWVGAECLAHLPKLLFPLLGGSPACSEGPKAPLVSCLRGPAEGFPATTGISGPRGVPARLNYSTSLPRQGSTGPQNPPCRQQQKHCGGSPPLEAGQAGSGPPNPLQLFHALASQGCLVSLVVLSLSLPGDGFSPRSGEHSNA